MRLLWIGIGWTCVGLGLAGAVLPLVPTTPFLLVAAWAFARSSRRFHAWLLRHPQLGRPILDWRRHGVVRPRAKALGVLVMIIGIGGTLLLGAPGWVLAAQVAVLALVALFLLTRPSHPPGRRTTKRARRSRTRETIAAEPARRFVQTSVAPGRRAEPERGP
jgi:uncharacterized membrane protein YbaN (DUF454 family)